MFLPMLKSANVVGGLLTPCLLPSSPAILMTITLSPRVLNRKRISVVLRQDVLQKLQAVAEWEGRSLSNLCAYWLEKSADDYDSNVPLP